jgi:hypothetical protein
MERGPAFISKELLGSTGDGGDAFLSRLKNKEDVSKLVVFDTWIRNSDRYPADEQEQQAIANRDNIFFAPEGSKFELLIIDHTHCFVETTLDDGLGDVYLLEDDRIYGYFPEFKGYVCDSALRAAVGRLRQMNEDAAREVVASIPIEWSVTSATRTKWAHVICERAKRVSEFVIPRLASPDSLAI